jgi:hypothetical protein
MGTVSWPTVDLSSFAGVWSTVDHDKSPATNGLYAGVSRVNTPVYVSRAIYGSQFIPSRYDVESPAGSYPSYAGEKFVEESEYLIVPQGCHCYWVKPNVALARKGLVTVPDVNYHWVVGRKNLTASSIAITKVQKSSLNQWYSNMANNEVSDKATEVLICETGPHPPVGCGECWREIFENSKLSSKVRN